MRILGTFSVFTTTWLRRGWIKSLKNFELEDRLLVGKSCGSNKHGTKATRNLCLLIWTLWNHLEFHPCITFMDVESKSSEKNLLKWVHVQGKIFLWSRLYSKSLKEVVFIFYTQTVSIAHIIGKRQTLPKRIYKP